jgi:hypothetical protein
MAKKMANRTQADGRVHLGIVVIKQLQTLIWWVRDRQKRGLALHAADFDADTLDKAAVVMKNLRKERADKEPSVSVLGKFDPDDFDTHEDAFLDLMSQMFGVPKEPLRYIVRPAMMPTAFFGSDDEEERMYQFPLEGGAFQMDNQTVYYRKLKAFLIDSPGWAWIEPHDMAENGRNAYLAWIAHYNGEDELSKRTALAKAKLEDLHYKSERSSMSFERCTEIMMKCFNTLHKDPDQRYSDQRKVEKLLKAIRCTDPELIVAKEDFVDQQHGRDFTAGACGYFSQQVSRVHGPAQLESTDSKPNPVSAAFMPLIDKQAAADGDERPLWRMLWRQR